MGNKPTRIMYDGEIYVRADAIDVKNVSILEKEAKEALDKLRLATRGHNQLNNLATKLLNDFELFSKEFSKEFK